MPILTFILLGLCIVGEPAPTGVGFNEVAIAASVMLIGLLSVLHSKGPIHGAVFNKHVLPYFLSFVVSTAIALDRGNESLSVLRSLAPYLVFTPILFLSRMKIGEKGWRNIAISLALCGTLHALYMIYLYVTATPADSSAKDLLFARTTLIDPRTTQPHFLLAAILPLPFILSKRLGVFQRCLWATVTMVAVFAAISTQTRSQIISIALAHATCCFLMRREIISQVRNTPGLLLMPVVLAAGAIYFLKDQLLNLSNAMNSRMELGDNGRFSNEFIPILQAWVESGPTGWLFGILPGTVFLTGDGESRTYVHNVVIYFLSYFGALGLTGIICLYFFSFRGALKNRWHKERDADCSVAFASLLVGLFAYGNFFAVHKSLGFNAILMIIVAYSLRSRPAVLPELPSLPTAKPIQGLTPCAD